MANLMMDAKGVRNMQNIPIVVNKHNTARVASCWFINIQRDAKVGTVIPQLTKIIRSGITFVSRNLR